MKLKKKIYTWEPGAIGHGEPFPAPAPKPWVSLNSNGILKIKFIQKGPICIHIIIIPEQIVENPDFKPILVVKE